MSVKLRLACDISRQRDTWRHLPTTFLAELALTEIQSAGFDARRSIATSMGDFLTMLRAAVEKAPGMRPFLRDGNPLTCTVTVVGVHPVAAMPFWHHWSDAGGMDRTSWIDADREMNRGAIGSSRVMLERFLPQISQRVIELNAPATQMSGGADVSEDYRTVDVLQFILGLVKPLIVICVGAAALRAIQCLVLPWTPAIIEAREVMDWDIEYEHALADEVNKPKAATCNGQRTLAGGPDRVGFPFGLGGLG